DELFRHAEYPVSQDEVAAVIVPHAGYVFSGKVAASGFNQIPRDSIFDRVFLIGSSHRVAFNGASVYSQGDYLTPLGRVEVDRAVVQKLVDSSPEISSDPFVHINEHSLEVELPFLQHHLKHPFKLVPVVMGPHDAKDAPLVAKALEEWFRPGNLFVISTDFSHYPAYEDAKKVDALTADTILKNDPSELLNILEKNRQLQIEGLSTSLCGWSSVLTLLYLTQGKDNLRFEKIDYQNSGDTPLGDKDRVVGYNAIAVFRSSQTKTKESGFSLNREEQQWLLKRARQALWAAVNDEVLKAPGHSISENIEARVGAFVSLYNNGKLRGCIGNFGSDAPLWKVIDRMTAGAALNDSRFLPVTKDEARELDIEISVLTPKRKVDDVSEIVPGKHGIYIEKDGRSGTFLPQVAEKTGWNLEEFLGHCARDKAGIGWDGWKDANVFVYEALVFGDKK
ncbi:AmmeMemoRadiSam system protein B, partial [bacterium]